jgi:hypothetical protein
VPGIFTDEHGGTAPAGIKGLNTAAGLDEALLVKDPVSRKENLPMNVADTSIRPAEGGVESGVVEPISMDLVESERYVERRGSGIAMLATQIRKELVPGDGQLTNSAFEEITGQRRFRGNDELGRVRPAPDLAQEGAEPAEILFIRTLLGTYLGNGKAEHVLKVRGER